MLRRCVPLALLLLAAVAWSWLAFGVHTVEVVGGELDQYVLRARLMLVGADNQDPYHPAGFPAWIAAVSWCGLEPFAAARLLGVAFGLVLLWASHALARLWLPPHAALLVAAIVGLSPYVLIGAVQACSDVPGTAMGTVALLLWCRAARDGATARRLVLAGLALGVAVSFRSPALWLLAGWLPLLRDGGFGERVRRCAWTALAVVLGMLPHLLWFGHVFGSPLHNRSWVNLLLKFHFHFDVPAWVAATPQYETILREHWTAWLWPAARDAATFLLSGLGTGLGIGPAEAGFGATLLSLAMLAGIAHGLLRGDRARRIVMISTGVYAVLLAMLFLPVDRHTIPLVLPTVLALALPFANGGRARGATAVLLVLLAGVAWQAPATLTRFVQSHPHAELAAVAALRDELGEPLRALLRPFATFATDDPWRELRRELDAHDQEFAVFARATSAGAIAALRAAPMPPDFRILRDDDLLVLDAAATPSPWLATAAVEVDGDTLQLRLELSRAPTDDPVIQAGFLVATRRDGALHWQHWPLPPTDARSYAATMPVGALRGVWHRFVPAAFHASGTMRRGEPFEVTP